MLPNARFKELLADIEPSATTTAQASLAHQSVRDHLCSHSEFKERWEGSFLAGSYTRDTAIRPKRTADGHERPDVDIIIETNFSTTDDPTDVLWEVNDALEDQFTVERVNKRSVRVITANAEIDVVPVVASGTGYMLPDRDLGYWKSTNPPAHTTWSANQNARFGGRFKPLVKLLKWWRRENKTGKRPKGFVLEVLVSLHAPTDETHYGEAFAQLLENIHAAYADLAALDLKPTLADPAMPGNDILSKVSITDWKNFLDRVRVHAGYARKAQSLNADEMDEATRLWRILFGNRLKATESAVKASHLGSTATATASAGYTFPDVNATPTKPRGFA
ncbi:nucleotidyltransferase [Deinococcus sp. LM3]|uniref:SMODS domain-containing nucleotidyltransferase n=1 Tax=Deinococcus sp. LM3 TaxID=1938608 RepID=UPI000993D69B|nr:nucleotidyltransferase [Deinococcus sp. LM3]OOV11928.1 nucleotidyltransferase [Deinococcus sp. LM3]